MVTPRQTIDSMKRVQRILRHCQDDPWVRKRVAQETSQWVRNGKQKPFDQFLTAIEERLNIKTEEGSNEGHASNTDAHANDQKSDVRGNDGGNTERAPARRPRRRSNPPQ